MTYKFLVKSPTDPHPEGLGFSTIEAATSHAVRMNEHLENWIESKWNMDYWKTKPEPFIVREK